MENGVVFTKLCMPEKTESAPENTNNNNNKPSWESKLVSVLKIDMKNTNHWKNIAHEMLLEIESIGANGFKA